MLRQYPGAAFGSFGLAHGGRLARAPEEASAGRAAESEHTLRAGRGKNAAGAQSGFQSTIPGDVFMVELSQKHRVDAWTRVDTSPFSGTTPYHCDVRPDAFLTGGRRRDRGRVGVRHIVVRAIDHGTLCGILPHSAGSDGDERCPGSRPSAHAQCRRAPSSAPRVERHLDGISKWEMRA